MIKFTVKVPEKIAKSPIVYNITHIGDDISRYRQLNWQLHDARIFAFRVTMTKTLWEEMNELRSGSIHCST